MLVVGGDVHCVGASGLSRGTRDGGGGGGGGSWVGHVGVGIGVGGVGGEGACV